MVDGNEHFPSWHFDAVLRFAAGTSGRGSPFHSLARMAKSRSVVPKAIRERLLNEYRHRCAICGADRPQVHHIDENPNNNDIANLLPLCPNHHLTDQHDPTTQIDPRRLAFFRKYKDPQILSPQFAPIFHRMAFLLSVRTSLSYEQLMGASNDLVRFVAVMHMGGYYHKVIHELLDSAYPIIYRADDPVAADAQLRTAEGAYREQLEQNSERVVQLVVEELRYQSWPAYAG